MCFNTNYRWSTPERGSMTYKYSFYRRLINCLTQSFNRWEISSGVMWGCLRTSNSSWNRPKRALKQKRTWRNSIKLPMKVRFRIRAVQTSKAVWHSVTKLLRSKVYQIQSIAIKMPIVKDHKKVRGQFRPINNSTKQTLWLNSLRNIF